MSAGTVIGRACIIAFAGIVAGSAASMVHEELVTGDTVKPQQPIPMPPQNPSDPPPGGAPALPEDKTTEVIEDADITIAQALQFFNAGTPFIDARRRDEYEAGHVQNAYWMPAELLTSGPRPEVMDYLVPTKPVIIYCGGGECDASKNVALLLQQAGFIGCLIMTDGYPAWQEAGHPTASGKPEYESEGGGH